MDAQLHQAFRALAADLEGVDRDSYREAGRDPLEPLLGLGDENAPLCFFGRDPGREEVRLGEPFVGAGGRLLRQGLHRHLYGREADGNDALRALTPRCFWLNTVPYKPLDNRAWPLTVKRRFAPLLRRVLYERWHGREVITLGREAFLWFGLEQSPETRRSLDAFWQREDRFTASLEVQLLGQGEVPRTFRLHPLPHPSPLNRVWLGRFPALLEGRLRDLGIGAAG